jgi:hypothetical protein
MNNIPCEDAIAAMQRKAVRDSADTNYQNLMSDMRYLGRLAEYISFNVSKYEKRAGS